MTLEQHRRFPIATATKKKTAEAPAGEQTHEQQEAAARAFAIEAAALAANTRCSNVVVLDVRGLSPVTDYFVIATGTSARQMRAVADEVEEIAAAKGNRVMSRSIDEQWILLDFIDVVVHVFEQDARLFYDLESLWGDAKRVEWK